MDASGEVTLTWATVVTALVAGLAAIVTASFGGVKQMIRVWFELAEDRLRRRYAAGVKQIALMYRVIEDAKQLPYVHRILMFTGHNCGGVPQPPKKFTVRAFFGWSQDAGKDPTQSFNFDIQADMHYMTTLQEMIKNGYSHQTTARMPEDAMLKSFYVREGVVDCRIFYLAIDPQSKELYYCSMANYQRSFTPDELHHLNHLVQRLRSLLAMRGNP